MYSLNENKILLLTSNSAQEATRNMKKICPQPAQTKTKPKDMENPTTTNNLSGKKLQRKPKTQDKTQTKKEVVAHGCPATTQKEKKIQQ